MKMFGVRNKDTGRIVKEFNDFFMARRSVTDKKQEVVERISENIYQRFSDNRIYITGVNYKWVPVEYRKDVL